MCYLAVFSTFSFYCYGDHPALHSFPTRRSSDLSGHVKMMGAVQPFISGAISKTVNMPEEVSVDDVMDLYVDAWKLDRKSTRLNSSHMSISYAVFCLKKKRNTRKVGLG